MISGRRSIHCDVASALSFCGKVKLASAEVLWGWNWMAAVGDDESVNITKDQTSSPNLSCKVKHFVNSMPYLNPRINYLYFFCLSPAGGCL